MTTVNCWCSIGKTIFVVNHLLITFWQTNLAALSESPAIQHGLTWWNIAGLTMVSTINSWLNMVKTSYFTILQLLMVNNGENMVKNMVKTSYFNGGISPRHKGDPITFSHGPPLPVPGHCRWGPRSPCRWWYRRRRSGQYSSRFATSWETEEFHDNNKG